MFAAYKSFQLALNSPATNTVIVPAENSAKAPLLMAGYSVR